MSGGIFSPPLHYDNKLFSALGQRDRGGVGGGLWEQGTCWLLEQTPRATTLRSGYLFLQALMVRNREQIIRCSEIFSALPEDCNPLCKHRRKPWLFRNRSGKITQKQRSIFALLQSSTNCTMSSEKALKVKNVQNYTVENSHISHFTHKC